MRTMLTVALTYIVAVTLLLAFNAHAHAQRTPRAHDAIVLCNALAEDSAAHVRLVTYEHTPEGLLLVYRCKRNGY